MNIGRLFTYIALMAVFHTTLSGEIAVLHVHSNDFAVAGVRIRPVGRTEWNELAAQGIPGAHLSALERTFGLAFLLKNDSQRAISDINVRYRKTPISGESDIFMTYLIPLTAKRGANRGLLPGRQIVISPSPDLNSALMRGVSLLTLNAIISDLNAEFSSTRYSKVTVGLDSVIFEDGLVVGPDEIDVIRKASDSRRAMIDIMREFVSRAEQGREPLRTWLAGIAADHRGYDKSTGRLNYYKEGAVGTARDLLFMMDRLRNDQWIPSVQLKLASAPPTNEPHR